MKTVAAARLLARHGLSQSGLLEVGGGFVNRVWVTDDVVLRLSSQARHATEAQIACGACAAGVRTARPLFWGHGYSIWERLRGKPVGEWTEALWDEVFTDLEKLHAHPPLPLPKHFPITWAGDVSLVEQTQERANWAAAERKRLLQLLSTAYPLTAPTFVHGDIYSPNVLVNESGDYLGLIDWGNAAWHTLEAEACAMEDLTPALKRWGHRLDLGLMWRLRLELFLKVLVAGRISPDRVRECWHAL